MTVTLQTVKSLKLGELAVNGNSPIFSVVKLGDLAVILCIENVFISLQDVLVNVCCFYVDFIFYLLILYVQWKLNMKKDT